MAQMLRVTPHSVIPGLVAPIFQDVPFRKMLAEVTNFGKMGDDVLYQPIVSRINSPTVVGMQWRQDLDPVSYSLGQLSFPYYTIHGDLEYDPNEKAKFDGLVTGISLPDFLEKIVRQGIAQREHYAMLFGFDTDAAQGIVLQGAVNTTLPADTHGKTKLTEYDPGELAQYFASVCRDIMTATYGMAKPAKIFSTVQAINYIKSTIVPLTTYQMKGAGVDAVAGVFGRVVGEWLGVGQVELIADDALKGKGPNGHDLITFVAPGLSKQDAEASENLNLVANSLPQNTRNTMMDIVEGLKEFVNPSINGVVSKRFSLQTTPGCLIRPEAVSTIEFVYA